MHSNLVTVMRLFPLLVPACQFRIGLQGMLAGLFPLSRRGEDVCHLSDYLRRDIGISEHRPPDRERPLG